MATEIATEGPSWFVTTREAWRLTGVPRDVLYAAVASGKLRSIAFGGSRRRLILVSDLERWATALVEAGGDDA